MVYTLLKHFTLVWMPVKKEIMNPSNDMPRFEHNLIINADQACLYINGNLNAHTAGLIWKPISGSIAAAPIKKLTIDLEKTTHIDTAGAALLCHIERLFLKKTGTPLMMIHLDPVFVPTIELARNRSGTDRSPIAASPLSSIEKSGQALARQLSETREFITYIGQVVWALIQSAKHPGGIRWKDSVLIAERAGVNALPIVALISFIVGLVMAFQAAIPMRMFGAEIYVANLIGISMVRELAPLMTAIVLAGRSASAFAAEIGTMRINEEIDALTVMGLDPVQFLIVPRIIASTIMTPLLTVFANLMGMIGGAVVITSMGYPIISYYNQIVSFVGINDLTGGLVKCFVFGILIAATGCIRGYQTKSGAAAVGVSTTRAVVTSIILIAVFDGIFSIVYYYLGI
jgi:phospholipid/cholesterol/gamma-HCH transport system permease protein